jgi:thioesterase domain-containing protein
MSNAISSLQGEPWVDLSARMKKLAHAAFGREVLRKVTDVVLPLNDVGEGPPFYCVHSITGVATSFGSLAEMLGPKQRFYGIQTPTKKRNAEFASSIAAMSEYYVEELIRFQPEGNLVLGGHSVGAIIALEMARRLRSRKREVSLLVVFDGELFNTGADISARNPRYWFKLLWNLPYWVRDFLMVQFTFRTFCQTVGMKISGFLKRSMAKVGLGTSGAGHAVGGFIDLDRCEPDHASFMKVLYDTQFAYVPEQYSGKMLVCTARTQSLLLLRQVEAAWRTIAPAAEVVEFSGTHTSMMLAPKGLPIARLLARRIAEIAQEVGELAPASRVSMES